MEPLNTIFILYVKDETRSKQFYKTVLNSNPLLEVPGMTEFKLNDFASLGIMPEKGIAKILGDSVPPPESGNGIPRCEIYLYVKNPEESLETLIGAGGKLISRAELRSWGDVTAYGADPDGHVIAFARML
jgi:lactoylglutathione lyase